MNEITYSLNLRSFMDHDDGWGKDEGRIVYDRLRADVDLHPLASIIIVSLTGVKRTDSSFARESVVSLTRLFRPHRGVYIKDVVSQDMLDNWDAAAKKLEQPIFHWRGVEYDILGPQPSEGLWDTLNYVLQTPVAVTSETAAALQLKVPNVSNKLKQLWMEGYILRRERAAASGGTEFEYFKIG